MDKVAAEVKIEDFGRFLKETTKEAVERKFQERQLKERRPPVAIVDEKAVAARLLEHIKTTLAELADSGARNARLDIPIRYQGQLDEGITHAQLRIITGLIHQQLDLARGLKVARNGLQLLCEW